MEKQQSMLKYDAEFNTMCNLYEFVKKDATFEKNEIVQNETWNFFGIFVRHLKFLQWREKKKKKEKKIREARVSSRGS